MRTNPMMEALLDEIRDANLDDPKALPQKLVALLNEGFVEERECVFFLRLKRTSEVQRLDFSDRTAFECFVNHVHVEDYLENGGLPPLELLGRGMAFANEVLERLRAINGNRHFRVIVASEGGVSCTVRFHTIRQEEEWVGKNFNGFKEEAVAILETQEFLP